MQPLRLRENGQFALRWLSVESHFSHQRGRFRCGRWRDAWRQAQIVRVGVDGFFERSWRKIPWGGLPFFPMFVSGAWLWSRFDWLTPPISICYRTWFCEYVIWFWRGFWIWYTTQAVRVKSFPCWQIRICGCHSFQPLIIASATGLSHCEERGWSHCAREARPFHDQQRSIQRHFLNLQWGADSPENFITSPIRVPSKNSWLSCSLAWKSGKKGSFVFPEDQVVWNYDFTTTSGGGWLCSKTSLFNFYQCLSKG